MQNQFLYSLLIFFLTSIPATVYSAPVSPVPNRPSQTDTQLNNGIKAAIEKGIKTPGAPFRLKTNCSDDKGIRSVVLYSDGVAIWKNSTQFQVSESARTGLLELLLAGQFHELASSYGGKHELVMPRVGYKIACQIWLDIGGLQKLSVQQADGTQSSRLKKLAASLLDRLEPLVKDGSSAKNLDDGLTKLEQTQLATQAFTLRLLELPPANTSKSGYILRIADGVASRQDYFPGKTFGAQTEVPINHCDLKKLTTAILSADITGMPVNLWSDSQIELEVAVLNHKKSVLARPFSRLRDKAQSDEQQRFDQLTSILRSFDPQTHSDCDQ